MLTIGNNNGVSDIRGANVVISGVGGGLTKIGTNVSYIGGTTTYTGGTFIWTLDHYSFLDPSHVSHRYTFHKAKWGPQARESFNSVVQRAKRERRAA